MDRDTNNNVTKDDKMRYKSLKYLSREKRIYTRQYSLSVVVLIANDFYFWNMAQIIMEQRMTKGNANL